MTNDETMTGLLELLTLQDIQEQLPQLDPQDLRGLQTLLKGLTPQDLLNLPELRTLLDRAARRMLLAQLERRRQEQSDD